MFPKGPEDTPTEAMQSRVDAAVRQNPTLNRPPMHCSEARAVNDASAAQGGNTVPNMDLYPVDTFTLQPVPRCAHCRITTAGSRCYTDPDFIGSIPSPPILPGPFAGDVAKEMAE
jgi:hypothetical protein